MSTNKLPQATDVTSLIRVNSGLTTNLVTSDNSRDESASTRQQICDRQEFPATKWHR